MKWQVGDLIDFTDEDPVFETLQAAIEHAETESIALYEAYLGLWTSQDEGAELLAVYHQGVGYWA